MLSLTKEVADMLRREKKEAYYDRVGALSIIAESALREYFARRGKRIGKVGKRERPKRAKRSKSLEGVVETASGGPGR